MLMSITVCLPAEETENEMTNHQQTPFVAETLYNYYIAVLKVSSDTLPSASELNHYNYAVSLKVSLALCHTFLILTWP